MLEIMLIHAYRIFLFPIKKVFLAWKKKILFDIYSYADRKTIFEGYNTLGMNTFVSSTFLGYGSYIADFSKIYNTKIGRYVSIGQNVCTAIGKHPISECISTSPSFFSMNPRNKLMYAKNQAFDEYICLSEHENYCIEIGNDVWIGNNVTLMQGIKIGDGAIIGAGAVVTKDVEPYSVCVGNPARSIKKRFDKEKVEQLLALKWWEKDLDWLHTHVEEFNNPELFFENIKV